MSDGIQTADMNFRFFPCLVAGLAYYIAMKVPELEPRLSMLKAAYDEQFTLAANEDREKASVRFVPKVGHYGTQLKPICVTEMSVGIFGYVTLTNPCTYGSD